MRSLQKIIEEGSKKMELVKTAGFGARVGWCYEAAVASHSCTVVVAAAIEQIVSIPDRAVVDGVYATVSNHQSFLWK